MLSEGYIRSEPKRGYFVEAYEPIDLHPTQSLKVSNPEEKYPVTVDFRAGAVDQQVFPLKAWRQCGNEVLKQDITYSYGNSQGDPRLRESLANYLLQSRGIRSNSDSIIIGCSTQQLLMHLSLLLKKDYSTIAVENPGYDGARTVFRMQGFDIDPIEVTDKGISIKELGQCRSNLVYITPSHQFPTGITMPISQRQQMLRWAQEREGYIIEDDYDSEFRYKYQPFPALSSIQREDRVIYIGTFSKAFLPSIRISYMILPAPLLNKYKQLFASVEQTASSIHQRTMALFMERGHWDSHIRKMRASYKRKMQNLVFALKDSFSESMISIIGSHSGLSILIQPKSSFSEKILIQKALEHGVKVYPTSQYFMNTPTQYPMLQLGFSNLSMDQICLGVQLLKKAWM